MTNTHTKQEEPTMSTTTKATTKPAKRTPAKPARSKPARKPAAAATKVKRTTAAEETLAAMAQAKAKPAARISAANIRRVQGFLAGKKPSTVLSISPNMLAELASGKRSKQELKPAQRTALRDMGGALGSDTYYGKKLAGMLWAIDRGVKS